MVLHPMTVLLGKVRHVSPNGNLQLEEYEFDGIWSVPAFLA